MAETPPASPALGKLGIPYRVFYHAGPVNSLEQAAQERGQRIQQVVRSILFRLSEDEYVMVLMAGPSQVSWKALRKYLGQSRVSMASEEEVLAVTGYRIGAVGPFGLPRKLRVLIDSSVLAEEEVSIGSGIRGTTVILKSVDLQRGLKDAEVVSLSDSQNSA
ncbi:MAG TPA: YbaK/EbsC family protein [Anaerolineales bacterium]|nr:YbaK/EbsC family protein [Anaerolineales bacterium]